MSVFLALVLAVMTPETRPVLRRVAVPAAALFAVAAFGWLQSLPWPEDLVGLLSPGHGELWGSLPAGEASPRLSVAPEVSRRAALSWAAVAAALMAGAVAGRRREARRWLGGAVVVAALFQVVYGAPRWLANADTIWGLAVPGMRHRLRGTFVNPDHLATFLGLALAVVFAWVWWAFLHARTTPEVERRVLLLAPPVLIWLTLFAALAFTGSRAGLAAALLGVTVQSLVLGRRGGRTTGLLLGGGAVAAGVAAVVWIGAREGFGRLLATSAYEITWSARLETYRASFELWRRYWLTGSGLGTFRDAFPQVQPQELPGLWRHAHSDYLELAVTTGLVGPVLLVVGLVFFVRGLPSGLSRRRRSEDRGAVLAAVGALVTAGAHELLDFGLTMPANAVTLAVLAGAALAVSAPRPSSSKSASPRLSRQGSGASSAWGRSEEDFAGGHRAGGEGHHLQ
ncbi:MAG: O-antigen ligase family protein [Acidobacteriota bacterium]|nr:O-antigen ligase family protein [Acidobacteriota bacterium]